MSENSLIVIIGGLNFLIFKHKYINFNINFILLFNKKLIIDIDCFKR